MDHVMSTFEAIWVLEGTLRTQHGPALAPTLAVAFPLGLDPENEGSVEIRSFSAHIHWRTAAPMHWDSLVAAIQTAAPDADGTLTLRFPYADDPTPTFLVFGPAGVSAHTGYWAMTAEPFRRWPAACESTPPAVGEPLDCPVCGTPKGLEKRVNAERNEIWICTTCPAVLFTYYDASQLPILTQVVQPYECP